MDNDEIYNLTGKVLSGEASEQEGKTFEKWLSENQENKKTFMRLKKIWKDTRIEYSNSAVHAAFSNVVEKMDRASTQYNRTAKTRSIFTRIAKVAAVIIVVFGIGLTIKLTTPEKGEPDPVQAINKMNPAGQKSKVFLPDGSTVWLNAESALSYPAEFRTDKRVVELTGEAFFEIAKDPQRPFTVTAGELTATVLGTSFNIKAYPGDKMLTVALATGKIKVDYTLPDSQKSFLLNKGEGLRYDRKEKEVSPVTVDIGDLISWKDGVMIFRDADFNEILESLHKWYGVEFEVKGQPRGNWQYTGKFQNEYLSNVLESISFGREFDYQIQDKKVVIVLP